MKNKSELGYNNESSDSTEEQLQFYIVTPGQVDNFVTFKVGITRNLSKRIHAIQNGNPYKLRVSN
jgi:hypothetical protein